MHYNYLDLAVLLLLLVGALRGFYKGFSHTLFSFTGKLLAILLSARFLTVFIEYFNLREIFMPNLAKIIFPYIPLSDEVKFLPLAPDLSELNLPGLASISREINKMYQSLTFLQPNNIGELLSLVLAKYILIVLAFLFLFFVFLLAFSIGKKLFDKIIGSFVLFGALNRILGFVFGAGIWVLLLSLFLGFSKDILFFFAFSKKGFFYEFKNLIDSSFTIDYFYYLYSLFITEGIKFF